MGVWRARDGGVGKDGEKTREGKKDGEVRRCGEFDSSSCQSRCIIDVLRIPHCH